jgi:endo-1,4-beta-mannosidase
MLTDEHMIDAELRLFDALAEAIGSHPRFLGFDLGNELDVINGSVSPKQGDAWMRRLLKHCEEIAPGRFHVNGVDNLPWFQQRTFSQRALATTGSASTFHAWVYWTKALKRYGQKGTGTLHLGEYISELAKAFATDLSRPTWMQEFGASPINMSAEALPEFAEAFSRNAMSSANLWGWTWWASHDIDHRFKGFGPFEYRLGLLTVDNKVKPVGRRFAKLIPEWRANPPQPAVRNTGLVLADPKRAGLEFADRFFNLIDAGVRPAIVLEEKAEDRAYLAARGLAKLVRP